MASKMYIGRAFIALALLLSSLSLSTAQAQVEEQKEEAPSYVVDTRRDPNEVYDITEVSPSFGDTPDALPKYLMKHIKYPKKADKRNEQGRVIVQFIVERNGELSDIKVVRGVSPSLDKEALRVVHKMPRWKPGRNGGKTVRTRFTMPIQFRLE